MQHRTPVGLLFYSVTVIQEGQREWYAFAEVAGELLSRSGATKEEALCRWQAAAGPVHRREPIYREKI